MISSKSQIQNIVSRGYCIGCGACAVVSDSFRVGLDEYGYLQAKINGTADSRECDEALVVCPFHNSINNEDAIGKALFASNCSKHEKIGYVKRAFAGFVKEGGYRQAGSSGGMGSWLIAQLFERNLIDGVLHVKETVNDQEGLLFRYGISRTVEEAKLGSKSRYYPVEMSEVLKIVKDKPGKYAIVGVPCFIKAVRLLALKNEVIRERIQYCIGLVCGHLKSKRFAEMLAWQRGIHPDDLEKIDFRVKLPGASASNYSVLMKNKQGKEIAGQVSSFYGYDWGKGLFKYEACDYCDDVFAETADITIGDAWLPEYVKDGAGTNIAVVRSNAFQEIVKEGIACGKLSLKELSADDAVKSQTGGLRHRREGLRYRLFLKDPSNRWCPAKRVTPGSCHLTSKQKKIFELRMKLKKTGDESFQKAIRQENFNIFKQSMDGLFQKYDALYRKNLWQRSCVLLMRIFTLVAKRTVSRQTTSSES